MGWVGPMWGMSSLAMLIGSLMASLGNRGHDYIYFLNIGLED